MVEISDSASNTIEAREPDEYPDSEGDSDASFAGGLGWVWGDGTTGIFRR